MAQLRQNVLRRERVADALPRADAPYPPDTTGMLSFVYPVNGPHPFGFTRITSTREAVRVFVAGGMHMWQRRQWVTFEQMNLAYLQMIWNFIFVREGATMAGLHSSNEEHLGTPVLLVRPLSLSLSRRRHRDICCMLGELGMGLVTAERAGRRNAPVVWRHHAWSSIVENRIPRVWRTDIVSICVAPLLPPSIALFRDFINHGMDRDNPEDEFC